MFDVDCALLKASRNGAEPCGYIEFVWVIRVV